MDNVIDPAWAWLPYRPTAASPWDSKKVGHLYRRAAFGSDRATAQGALKAGPEKTITALLKGGQGSDEFDQLTAPIAEGIGQANNGDQAGAWWVYRMLYGPHPLREKLTLFWHNHFATSNAKVRNARFMLGQYQLLQQHALGSFATLLREMSTDRAMMVWLDTRDSKKAMPNENYARELMELFSLGIGNYSEKDVREAARAFTGWQIKAEKAAFDPDQHDAGVKIVLGQKGRWKPDDIVRVCLEQPSAPRFIATKLYRFFVNESVAPAPDLVAPLAKQLKESNYDLGGVVSTILRSNLFFSPEAYRSRVKSPVDFALGIVKALEGKVGTGALAKATEDLGQKLFYPPSVKGWDGGTVWLNGHTLLFRQNLALALTSTEDARFGRRTDPAALVRKIGKDSDADIVDFFVDLFLQGEVSPGTRERLLHYASVASRQTMPVYWTAEDVADHRARALCHLVLTLPEFQLD
jgi:uncharacterized protein (DUF1800 family)